MSATFPLQEVFNLVNWITEVSMKKNQGTILIVDDDDHVVVTSRMILKQYFENIESLSSPKKLETRLKQSDIDVVLLDMNFQAGVTSGNEGIFWMNRIRVVSPHTQVVLQTAYSDIELAIRSIKEGAVDFLPKPWDKEKLIITMMNAYQQALARKKNADHKSKQKTQHEQAGESHHPLIGQSVAMQPVLNTIEQVSATDATILILGENGTGKELVARMIHERSNRARESFITVDVGAIPATLFESEMFGHQKGAFTDAKEPRTGKFELAHKGTLFLDEIGNLAPDLQVKLLSLLQTRTVTRVGSNTPKAFDVRVICATNAPIYDLVKSGVFRQDLFYRIKTIEVHVPPLRDRADDIPALAEYYFQLYCKRYNKMLEAGSGLFQELKHYVWPGNVRELQHAMERAVILCSDAVVKRTDFQFAVIHSDRTGNESLRLSEVEREVIRKAIKKSNNNLTRAAEELGIGRTTLYRKIEEYGLGASGK